MDGVNQKQSTRYVRVTGGALFPIFHRISILGSSNSQQLLLLSSNQKTKNLQFRWKKYLQKDGPGAPGGQSWTAQWLKFDNSYFKVRCQKISLFRTPQLFEIKAGCVGWKFACWCLCSYTGYQGEKGWRSTCFAYWCCSFRRSFFQGKWQLRFFNTNVINLFLIA